MTLILSGDLKWNSQGKEADILFFLFSYEKVYFLYFSDKKTAKKYRNECCRCFFRSVFGLGTAFARVCPILGYTCLFLLPNGWHVHHSRAKRPWVYGLKFGCIGLSTRNAETCHQLGNRFKIDSVQSLWIDWQPKIRPLPPHARIVPTFPDR